MFQVIFEVVKIITPAHNELAGKYAKSNYIGWAFPPVMRCESKWNRSNDQGGAEVSSFKQTL